MRFVIVDDVDHVRDGLRAIIELEPGWHVVGEANDGRRALYLARRLRPNIVILDAHLPGIDVTRLTCELKSLVIPPVVVLLTIHDLPETRVLALTSGADLCIAKGDGMAGLLRSLLKRYGYAVATATA